MGFPSPAPTHEHPTAGHSHTFLLPTPLAQTLFYSPYFGQWKQTRSSVQMQTESQDYPGREAGLASRANLTRLTQLLTALPRGKERAMWVSGPFLLRIHCCPHGVGGGRHHIPCNLRETRYGISEKSGFHCPRSTGEEAVL